MTNSSCFWFGEGHSTEPAVRANCSELGAGLDRILVVFGPGLQLRMTRPAAEALTDALISNLAILEDLRAKADAKGAHRD